MANEEMNMASETAYEEVSVENGVMPKKKSKKKLLWLLLIPVIGVIGAGLLIALIAILLVVFLVILPQHEINSYKKDVAEFCDLTYEAGLNLKEIGDEIEDELYRLRGNTSYSSRYSAYNNAEEYMQTEIALAEDQKEEILMLLEELDDYPDDWECEYLYDEACDLYDAYYYFYDFVIDPSGDYYDFSWGYDDVEEDFVYSVDTLDSMLGKYGKQGARAHGNSDYLSD